MSIPFTNSWRKPFYRFGFVVAAYLIATIFTDAHYMGDTVHYTASILQYRSSKEFWDFGHLLWRPSGWLLSQVLHPVTHLLTGADDRANVIYTLMAVSWVAGLMCVLLQHALICRFCSDELITNAVTIGFILSNGFLNYAQTGSSYIPGMALLLFGLYILLKNGNKPASSWWTGALAGSAFAGALAFWFLYIWAIPAALAAPLFWFGFDRQHRRLLVQTSIAFLLVLSSIYGVFLIGLGIYSVAGVRTWIMSASHGITTGGVSRMIFTFAQSLIDMGDEGRLFKRYLVGDPYNPISLTALFRLSLWKLLLFYLFLASTVINLLRFNVGKRILGLLIVNAVPVIGFAIFWSQGRNYERFFPLYPLLFLALACSLCSDRTQRLHKFVVFVFILAASITNIEVMAKSVLNREQETVATRVKKIMEVQKSKGQSAPKALVIVAGDDQMWGFGVLFLLNPINRDLSFETAVTLGTTETSLWRQDMASKILAKWNEVGDVWVTTRVLSARPKPEWNWTEGDDPRVSWRDINAFFSQLEMGSPEGGEDGFMLLTRSARNQQLLTALLTSK